MQSEKIRFDSAANETAIRADKSNMQRMERYS